MHQPINLDQKLKPSLFLTIVIILITSCQKQLTDDKLFGEHIASEATLAEKIYAVKHTGVYSDTCSIARNGFGIVLNGNSILERMNYYNWKFTWINQGYPIINRAMGGTTWGEKINYVKDLTTYYRPNDVILYDGENEFLRASRGDSTVAIKLLVNFNRTMDSIRRQNSQVRVYVVSMITCPVLFKKGYARDITKVNESYKTRVARDAALYPNKVKFIDIRPLYPTSAGTKFEADSIHIKLTAYADFYNTLKAALPKPGTGAWSAPDAGNKLPIANAGADVVIGKSWNYNPWIYGTYSKDPDGWIASFNWTCVSGTQYIIVTPDAGKTRLDNLAIGVYIFRLTVTDNKGAKAYDDVRVTVNQ